MAGMTNLENHTLRLSRLSARTLVYPVLLFTAILFGGEAVLRVPWVQNHLPNPAIFDGYRDAERKFALLDKYVKQNGPVDCVFLGNSRVETGIDPLLFDTVFEQKTGQPINCFNMGMESLRSSVVPSVADLLIRLYHPKIMIYGTSASEFEDRTDRNSTMENFPNNSLVRYLQGNFNAKGWLIQSSYFFRFLISLPAELNHLQEKLQSGPDTPAADAPLDLHKYTLEQTIPTGFDPLVGFMPRSMIQKLLASRKMYPFSQADLDGFKQMIELAQQNDVQLFIYETPDIIDIDQFDQGGSVKPMFRTVVADYARQSQTPFWITNGLQLLPENSWADNAHLHVSGAIIMTRWLAERTAETLKEQFLQDQALERQQRGSVTSAPAQANNVTGCGVNDQKGQASKAHKLSIDLPQDAVILNAFPSTYDRAFLQSSLEYYVDWTKTCGTAQQKYSDLMLLFDQARLRNELNLASSPQQALNHWYETLQPADLRTAGIDYVLYREDPDAAQQNDRSRTMLGNSAYYQLVQSWDYPPLHEKYSLYRLMGK